MAVRRISDPYDAQAILSMSAPGDVLEFMNKTYYLDAENFKLKNHQTLVFNDTEIDVGTYGLGIVVPINTECIMRGKLSMPFHGVYVSSRANLHLELRNSTVSIYKGDGITGRHAIIQGWANGQAVNNPDRLELVHNPEARRQPEPPVRMLTRRLRSRK